MTDRLGKYELRQILGKGAMGTVYEGFDPIIARRVAIKTVRLPDADDVEAQEELSRFQREAQAAGRLSHPNIVGVYDYGETSELAYIVMEFVDGTTLKHVLDKKDRFELAEIVRIMESLLAGLQFSHDRGVVHRDIKPANIMLTKSGEIKIADFGIARIESSSMTQAGTMLGTPSYMSPEQFMGQTVDSRTDIYSSGAMLYQLLTGDKPFEGGLTAIMHKVLNTEPPPPSALSVTVPRSFDAVVMRAMEKRPQDRYPTAAEFARAVRAAFEAREQPAMAFAGGAAMDDSDATVVAPRPGAAAAPAAASGYAPPLAPPTAPAFAATPAPQPVKKRSTGLIAGAAIAALALIGGGAYFILNKPASAPPAPAAAPSQPTIAPAPLPMNAAQQAATLSTVFDALPCTMLSAATGPGATTLTGLAGTGEAQSALTGAIQSLPAGITITNKIQTINGPYCDVLNTIRPYHNIFPTPDTTISLALANGKTTLHDGDLITVKQTMPNFGGYLQTDYFSSDGSILHLYPTSADPKKFIPPSNSKTLGDPTHGGAAWQVSAPYGTDLIITIASTTPLFTTPRPADENASDYLPDLRAALQNAVSAGATVAVNAIPVITQAK
jgi:serine/threonine-protein kinase